MLPRPPNAMISACRPGTPPRRQVHAVSRASSSPAALQKSPVPVEEEARISRNEIGHQSRRPLVNIQDIFDQAWRNPRLQGRHLMFHHANSDVHNVLQGPPLLGMDRHAVGTLKWLLRDYPGPIITTFRI